MSYIKAEEILPIEVIELIQQYVDGQNLYIPRKAENRLEWGTQTETRRALLVRNDEIYADYLAGEKVSRLAVRYYLSEKSIQRIIREKKLIKKSQ